MVIKPKEETPVVIGIEFEITGTYPLLQHRFSDYSEAKLAGKVKSSSNMRDASLPRDQAEANCYRLADGTIGHPAQAIARAMRDAGVAYKVKGTRQTLKYVLPAAVRMLEEFIQIVDPATGKAMKEIEVDSRSVVNQKVKVRLMCHRAKIEKWIGRGRLSLDTELVAPEVAHQILNDAGRRLGIGAFRPQSGGPFGVFRVTSWQEVKLGL